MSRPRLSVAMCTFNGERHIHEQLQSIACQRRKPDELVICDDGSTDGTIELLKGFASVAPFPTRVFENDSRLGSTKNFGRAIGMCSGDWIFLADQDDVWNPKKLERFEEEFLSRPACGLFFSDGLVVDEALRPLGYTLWDKARLHASRLKRLQSGAPWKELARANIVTGATMAFHARFKDEVKDMPQAWVHDGWIALMVATKSGVFPINEPLILYRQHGANQIGATRRTFLHRFLSGPDWERHTNEVAKASIALEIVRRHPGRDVPLGLEAALSERSQHFRVRLCLPPRRVARLKPALGELLSGRYHRWSTGFLSFFMDVLLAPVNPSNAAPERRESDG